jgi:hypothetical protein
VVIHRFVWAVSTVTVMGSAIVYDVATGGLLRLAVFGSALAAFGGLLAFAFVEDRPDRGVWVRRGVVWSGLAMVAADALVATWGGIGMLVGLALVGTSPVVLRLARRLRLQSSRRTSGPPESLSTRELLHRWEWTTAEVLRPRTPVARRLVLVEERRRLLDELQDRDPEHFDAWLVSAVPDGLRERPRPDGR